MTYKDFRRMQNLMDQHGFMTSINRTGKGQNKMYEAIANGIILKKYKTRSSAKKIIVKEFKSKLLLTKHS